MLSWTAPSDGTGSGISYYHVKVQSASILDLHATLWEGDVTGTSKVLPTPLAWEKDYTWMVTAYDLVGKSTTSDSTALKAHDTTAPGKPGIPAMASADDKGRSSSDRVTNVNRPTFTWAASADTQSGVAGYYVSYLDPTPDGADGDDYWVTTNSWSPGLLDPIPDGTWTLYVAAKDKARNMNLVSGVASIGFTINTVAPTVPTFVAPVEGQQLSTNSPTFKWTAVPNAWKYQVVVREDQLPWSDTRSSPETTTTSWTVPSTSSLGFKDWGWQINVWDVAGNQVTGANGVVGVWGHFKGVPAPLNLAGLAYDWTELDLWGKTSVQGAIDNATDQRVYRLVPKANGLAVINTDTADGDLDTLLVVYDSSGNRVAWADNDLLSSDSTLATTLTAGSVYYIMVSGARGTTGSFQLDIDTADPTPHTVALAPNTGDGNITSQSISPAGEADYYKVIAPKNTAGSLSVTVDSRSSSLNASVAVWEENLGWFNLGLGASVILKGTDQGHGATDDPSVYVGASAGFTYYIRVTGEAGSTGVYNLAVDFNTDDLPNSLDNARLVGPNVQVPAHIDMARDVDVVAINAHAGVTYTVTTGAPAGSKLASGTVKVYDQAHTVVASTSFARGSGKQVTFTPTAEGVYYLQFAASSTTATGDYYFTVSPSVTDAPQGGWGTAWSSFQSWATSLINDSLEKPLFTIDASIEYGASFQLPYTIKLDAHAVKVGISISFDLADLAGLTLDAAEHYTTVWIQANIEGPGVTAEVPVQLKDHLTHFAWGPIEAGVGVTTMGLTDANGDGYVDANDDPATWKLDPSVSIMAGPVDISVDVTKPGIDGVMFSLDSTDYVKKIGGSASLLEVTVPLIRADIPTESLLGPIAGIFQGTLTGQNFFTQLFAASTDFRLPPRNVNLFGLEI
ncbi:MAG: Ig-like domain-containing protein [Planctomycetota bacterium]|nr:Ig-like domain-containing protein [Planctomycetota bacterium]